LEYLAPQALADANRPSARCAFRLQLFSLRPLGIVLEYVVGFQLQLESVRDACHVQPST